MDAFLFETERFGLRKFQSGDGRWLYLLNKDPLVLKYTGDLPFSSEEDAEKFVSQYDHYKEYGYGRWAVIHKSQNEAVGWCGLKNNGHGNIDLGFRFFQKYWNQGFAQECAKACIRYGMEKLELIEIIGRCSIDHAASINVLKKSGMLKIGDDHDQTIGSIEVYKISSNDSGLQKDKLFSI